MPSLIKLTFFFVFLKDSGQAIPLVVESCIRFINLYGKRHLSSVCSVHCGIVLGENDILSHLGRLPVLALLQGMAVTQSAVFGVCMSVSGVREGRLCEGPSTSGHRAAAMTRTEGLFQLCPHSQSINCKLHEGNGVGNLLTMV